MTVNYLCWRRPTKGGARRLRLERESVNEREPDIRKRREEVLRIFFVRLGS